MIHWQTIIATASVTVGCLLTTGCAITRKSASIDSTSRMPFFGMELAPARKSAPETQRIRRDGSIPLEPEPAKLVTPAKPSDSSWWQRLTGAEKEKPAAIAIPRTDVVVGPPLPKEVNEPSDESFDAIEF